MVAASASEWNSEKRRSNERERVNEFTREAVNHSQLRYPERPRASSALPEFARRSGLRSAPARAHLVWAC